MTDKYFKPTNHRVNIQIIAEHHTPRQLKGIAAHVWLEPTAQTQRRVSSQHAVYNLKG